ADVLREHVADPHAAALAFDAATRRELLPWYRAARDQDRDAREVAARQARGERGAAPAPTAPGQAVDPRAFVRSVLRDGLIPALRTAAEVVRAFMRVFNLLAPPDALISGPVAMGRILAAWRERERRPPLPAAGPERDTLVDLLARAA